MGLVREKIEWVGERWGKGKRKRKIDEIEESKRKKKK